MTNSEKRQHTFTVTTPSWMTAPHTTVHFNMFTDATLPEAIESFERFLLALGYSLPEGAHLGYEYDEPSTGIDLEK